MTTITSPTHSEASTTLSEYVKRTFPLRQVSRRPSAQHMVSQVGYPTDILQAVTGVDQRLRRLERQSAVLSAPAILDEPADDYQEPTEDELDSLLSIDDNKMRLMLDSSLLDSSRVQEYMNKLHAIRDAIRKQRRSRELAVRREAAYDLTTYSVTDDEIAAAFTLEQANDIEKLAGKMGASTSEQVSIVKRACVHDSVFHGRDSNRMLALLGDGALAVMLKEEAVRRDVAPARLDHAMKATQTNDKLRDLCVAMHLHTLIVVDSHTVDKDSRTVAATFMEALFGAIYLIGGLPAVRRINDKHIKVCRFDELFDGIK